MTAKSLFVFLLLVSFAGSRVQAASAEDCANLAKLAALNTMLTSTSLVPAAGPLPEYCRVQGRVDAEIGFEVRLPTTWNGKFYFPGNPGFAGSFAAPGPGLVRGYAEATTDTGHL
jgi:feruloyl esterase